jgi:hypothetical protein
MTAFLVRLSLHIIEFASALTLLLLALGWALCHVGEALLSLGLDISHIRAKFRSVKEQSTETELIVSQRGLSGR